MIFGARLTVHWGRGKARRRRGSYASWAKRNLLNHFPTGKRDNRHFRDCLLTGHAMDMPKSTRLTVRPEGANYQ
jgi:hypothetical protein